MGKWAAGPWVFTVSHASDLERRLLWLRPGLVHVHTLPLTSWMGPGASAPSGPQCPIGRAPTWWVHELVQEFSELSSAKHWERCLAGDTLTRSMVGKGRLPECHWSHTVLWVQHLHIVGAQDNMVGDGVGCGAKHVDKVAFWKHVISKQPGGSQGSRPLAFPQLLSPSPLRGLPVPTCHD